MKIWSGEINELNKLYATFRGHLPDIVRELEQLIRTDDPNVVMLYSRRCLEVIVTELCETELNRPRKTEPLKGIIDKLNSEEKVPQHIITSMISLNSMATYGAHPKDFDPEQVKPVLNNLAIIIKWYLKYKDFQIVSKTETREASVQPLMPEYQAPVPLKKKGRTVWSIGKWPLGFMVLIFAAVVIIERINVWRFNQSQAEARWFMSIDAYDTVQIGDQVWMAENLRTVILNDGTPIPLVEDAQEWENLTTPAYCWYNNDKEGFGSIYGPLYNWYAVNTGRLCPPGWRVPTKDEWETLISFAGDSSIWSPGGDLIRTEEMIAAIKLKHGGYDQWKYHDQAIYSTNELGFGALPGGYRNIYGPYFDIGQGGFWWSSTECSRNNRDAHNIEMNYNRNDVGKIRQYKQFGMSVRCIRD